MSEWISIKDRLPPQDGSQFLGYSEANEDAPIYVLVYKPERCFSNRVTPGGYYLEASGECYFEWYPTHWMLLPEPPKESE